MGRESNPTHSPDRTRYLNIVYFVESARSHTIRINLTHARWCLAGALLILTWSVGSIVWITALELQMRAARTQLESSLATIFDYQIKNDQVFEQAYPPDATNSYYSELAQLPSNNPTVDPKAPSVSHDDQIAHKPVEKSGATTQDPSTDGATGKALSKTADKLATAPNTRPAEQTLDPKNEKFASTTAPGTSSAAAVKAEADQPKHPLIEISNTKTTKGDSDMSLVFDINNRNPKKAEGYIWAIATVTDDTGKRVTLAAPEHTKINPGNGDIQNIRSTYRFSIQRYKRKSFDFKDPAIKGGKVTALKINFTDINGKDQESIHVPVDQIVNTSTNAGAPSDSDTQSDN